MNPEQEEWVGHQRLYFRVSDAQEHFALVASGGASPGEVRADPRESSVVRRAGGGGGPRGSIGPGRRSERLTSLEAPDDRRNPVLLQQRSIPEVETSFGEAPYPVMEAGIP
jgi:hypothetical protein